MITLAVNGSQLPWGLNYAIRAAEQRRHPHDPELGVAPDRRRGGEETAVITAILAEGGKGSWVWDATVFQMIPPQRQTTAYILEFYAAHGYDSLLAHRRSGFVDRLKGLVRTSIPAAGYLRDVVRGALRNQPSVSGWVGLGEVRGTIYRYLTR